MAIRIDTPDGGQIVYGVNSRFKRSICGQSFSNDAHNQVIHLTLARPIISTVTAEFQAINSGLVLEEGEFFYHSDDGLLEIINTDLIIGIEVDPADTFVIPLIDPSVIEPALTSIHLEPEEILV